MALVMSLALRFLPTLSDETKAIIDAQSARGGTIETGSPATRVKALFAIIVPILRRRCVTRIISVWRLTRAATRKASTAPIESDARADAI